MSFDWARLRKLAGGLLGGITGTAVAGVLTAIGVHVSEPGAAGIAALLAALGVFLAKPNVPVREDADDLAGKHELRVSSTSDDLTVGPPTVYPDAHNLDD